MKRLSLFACALGAAALLAGCGSAASSSVSAPSSSFAQTGAEYHQLTAEEAKARLDSGDTLVLLDVRTQEEYEAAHIPGALLIPNEEIGTEPPAALPDQNAEILVYCRSGNRSRQAAEKLVAMGYTAVYDFGGINDWPYETVSGPEEAPAASSSAAGGVLSAFTSRSLAGDAVDQSVFAGKKLTMVNIWATYCGPCIREMPELGELAAENADAGVQIIGIPVDVLNSDGSYSDSQLKEAASVVESTEADYLHILPSADLIEAKLSQVYAVPTTIFVDENGTQVGQDYMGSRSKADWQSIIDELLKEVT